MVLCTSRVDPIQNAINLPRILKFPNERESEKICSSFNRIIVWAFLRIIGWGTTMIQAFVFAAAV